MVDHLRALPSVDEILAQEPIQHLLASQRRDRVVSLIRRAVDQVREQLRSGSGGVNADLEGARRELLGRVVARVLEGSESSGRSSMRPAINATGIILHTGLGRAPLAPAAMEALQTAAVHYCNLELDLESGERGSRLIHVETMLCELTGGEAAAVVNNNAGAVLLMLSAMARDREVVVSRGELVEIGGSFRIPDIIAASGARMREVGTTNRTHLRDYEGAIGDDTALLLAVHPSNYRVRGFTAGVDLSDLVALGRRTGTPVAYDLGGGAIVDLAEWHLPHEPVVRQSLGLGVDVVSFSGDKVLGGPQAGIIVGGREPIGAMCRNPLMRALRCDKLILSALEATLRLYGSTPEILCQALPSLRMMTEPVEEVAARAARLVEALPPAVRTQLRAEVAVSAAQAGSGALPLAELDSRAVSLQPETGSVEELARRLRLGEEAVIGRISRGQLLLDMRTVRDEEVERLARAVIRSACATG
ncbi:L-seryl-tRNA(Sec) selenium transferase [Candidatus Latescibacterota bacterium]